MVRGTLFNAAPDLVLVYEVVAVVTQNAVREKFRSLARATRLSTKFVLTKFVDEKL